MAKKKIIFIHPDLGIGGAERLVVDAAVGLQKKGHEVIIYTSHCDPNHCFDEAKDGTLKVRVRGNTIIPPNIGGRFSILCAILRQIHLAFLLLYSSSCREDFKNVNAFFVDQLSACIPLLRWKLPYTRILFYCHFPDKLLASRQSAIKSLYRIPFDWIEGLTTGLADTIVVNSKYTASVFKLAFPTIDVVPDVVYPCVDTEISSSFSKEDSDSLQFVDSNRKLILSINRFEKKKNIELAIKAFAGLSKDERQSVRLVIAGGYDPRVAENVIYHSSLVNLATSLDLSSTTCNNFITSLTVPKEIEVLFLLSIPSKLKTILLNSANLLVYTPSNEHFGIVPLEAMLAGTPVLATNTGGPLESVQDDGVTGWLRQPDPPLWTDVMRTVLFQFSDKERSALSNRAKKRVLTEFSKEKMAENLDAQFTAMAGKRRTQVPLIFLLAPMGIYFVVCLALTLVYFAYFAEEAAEGEGGKTILKTEL